MFVCALMRSKMPILLCVALETNDVKFLKIWGLYTVCRLQSSKHMFSSAPKRRSHPFSFLPFLPFHFHHHHYHSRPYKSKRPLSLSHLLARNIGYGDATRQNTEYRFADDEEETKKNVKRIFVYLSDAICEAFSIRIHTERETSEKATVTFFMVFFSHFLHWCHVVSLRLRRRKWEKEETIPIDDVSVVDLVTTFFFSL